MENEPDYEWRQKFDARYKTGRPRRGGVGSLLLYLFIAIAVIMAILRWHLNLA
jgi:hypothetical protein